MTSGFTRIPKDKTYAAYDRDLNLLFVTYPSGFEIVWGKETGQKLVRRTAENIDVVIAHVPPAPPFNEDPRHSTYKKWVTDSDNAHFAQGPAGRSGLWHFGLWNETGKPYLKSVLTKDTLYAASGARRAMLVFDMIRSFGNVTKTFNFCFEAVDSAMRDMYHSAYAKLPHEASKQLYSGLPHMSIPVSSRAPVAP